MTVYLFTAYVVVAFFVAPLRRTRAKSSPFRRILLFGILFAPLFPYAAVALQTALFGNALRHDVRQAMLDSGMSDGDIRIMRVLSISPSRADVYVTELCSSGPEMQVGNIFTLRRTSTGWKFDSWNTIWSDCGSADGNTFPPYPEAKEF